jgi:hypothetical protein
MGLKTKFLEMENKKYLSEFEKINIEILELLNEWEPILLSISEDILTKCKNKQNRTIKQIVGHMVDSATNNTHRIIHLQYQKSPVQYPDYANLGNNDRWIALQNYQEENWINLINLWKYSNIHITHVIRNVNIWKLDNEWTSALNKNISLKDMIIDYLPHFKLHLNEIEELMKSK